MVKQKKRMIIVVTVFACIAFAVILALSGAALNSASLNLVKNGKPVAIIIIPEQPLPVESYAAEELQYHVKSSTGAELKIISEDKEIPSGTHIYLGKCKATVLSKVDPSNLPGNSYVIKTIGSDFYIAGKDASGDPLLLNTLEGTLFGVYDILENNVGVRWLWPGKLGEVIPKLKNLSLPSVNASVQPSLWFQGWRNTSAAGSEGEAFKKDEAIWLKRQKFGKSIQISYGHSFGGWWERFGKTHPEYMHMMPDGTRGLDKYNPDPQYNSMCISNPDLVKQKVQDWKDNGMPEYINVCENDGWAGCACPVCLSWDVPDPSDSIDFDKRLDAAKRTYDGKEGNRSLWMLKLGSLSDRYAGFWKAVYDEASKYRRDVKVVSYAYDNYVKPPMKTMLNQNILLGVVPMSRTSSLFPYNKTESDEFRKYWKGWAKTGAVQFLRPNYTLQGHNFPVNYARILGEDLKFATANSMKGTDFDALTGQYSTQGTTLYMLARILNHPDASVDQIIDEYCSAFGPAKGAVREYFDHWEAVYSTCTLAGYDKLKAAKSKYKVSGTSFFALADGIYTPEVMSKGWAILEKAKNQSAGNALASARVEWLSRGLKQADLVLAAERAYEYRIDTGDTTQFAAVHKALEEFRANNWDSRISNFTYLNNQERRLWNRSQR